MGAFEQVGMRSRPSSTPRKRAQVALSRLHDPQARHLGLSAEGSECRPGRLSTTPADARTVALAVLVPFLADAPPAVMSASSKPRALHERLRVGGRGRLRKIAPVLAVQKLILAATGAVGSLRSDAQAIGRSDGRALASARPFMQSTGAGALATLPRSRPRNLRVP